MDIRVAYEAGRSPQTIEQKFEQVCYQHLMIAKHVNAEV